MGTLAQTRRKQPADTRITAKLIGNIKRRISTGAIVPGAKFPPERELAKEFGVNRASLRQALKVLEIMGVLTQRVGDGTYLSASAESILKEPLDFLILLDDLSHHELMETRMIVEPELAARAARCWSTSRIPRRCWLRLQGSRVTDTAMLCATRYLAAVKSRRVGLGDSILNHTTRSLPSTVGTKP